MFIHVHNSGRGKSRARGIGNPVCSWVVHHVVDVLLLMSLVAVQPKALEPFQTHGTAAARSEAPALAVLREFRARDLSMSGVDERP